MSRSILTGSISGGSGSFLYGRRNFFFEPNVGQGEGVQGGGEGNQNQQQQNQQQQQQELESPFKGVDLNLLDDAARQAIQRAEQQLKDLHGRASQASAYQSEKDRLTAQVKTYEATLQQLQNQQLQPNQNQQQQQQPLTFEQELEQEYLANGIEGPAAKSLAKMNAKIFHKFGERVQGVQDQRLAPIIGNVVQTNTQNAFNEAMQSDRHGLFQNQQVAQAVWERAEQMANAGQLVNAGVLSNLARIFSFDLAEGAGLPQVNGNQQPQQQQQFFQQNQAPMNQQTRFTFPGAGTYVRPPAQQQQVVDDPETTAAMAATVAGWSVKPKQFKDMASNNGVRITRGGI